ESAAELRRVGPASVAAVRAADEAGRERAPAGIGGGMGHDPAAPRPASSMADALRTAFGPGGTAVTAFAPGRVNLIGEHTDYNDGFVLPMAIEDGIEMAARSRAGREIRAHAVDLGETVAFSLEQPIRPDPTHPWSNYIRGVLWALSRAGIALGGMDLAFGGTLPQGAGLSSSAALQVATALTARALLRFTMDVPRLARICQESENELVGVKVGIMDPFVSLAAREGHALFLDCRSLAFEQVPLALGDHVVAICYSGVKHALVASEYNVRRRQCAAGVEVLRTHDPRIRALRDASLEALEACRAELDPVVYRRCRHVVTENARVLESKSALRTEDLRRFGELMDASHASLRDDYQVSCAEIDLLVDLARQSQGVLGARITGGGFGGCTVNLVARGAVESFRKEVLGEYRRRTGLDGWVFVSEAADGASTAGEVG
ncbi:MAG: galactokinase, partial [Deltaproteobacteria bacterium]